MQTELCLQMKMEKDIPRFSLQSIGMDCFDKHEMWGGGCSCVEKQSGHLVRIFDPWNVVQKEGPFATEDRLFAGRHHEARDE